jgi:hypothetical protein
VAFTDTRPATRDRQPALEVYPEPVLEADAEAAGA